MAGNVLAPELAFVRVAFQGQPALQVLNEYINVSYIEVLF
jgi:hypothetical protein